MAYSRLVLIAVLVVVVGLIGSGPSAAQAQTCQRPDFGELIGKCGRYVAKSAQTNTTPSEACCKVLRGIDLPCACKHVTKAMESFVSPKKAVDVARHCRVSVKSGTKCGSYTVPRA